MRALFDTNILIDYFNGDERAKQEIEIYEFRAISVITYIELLVGLKNLEEIDLIKKFLHVFFIIDVDLDIAELTVTIRKKYNLKIPDAIILATAQQNQCLFVTRDTKDFSQTLPIVRVPYTIHSS